MARKPAELTVQRPDILLAAARVFYERGYHGAKMEDIARAVDLTAGSLYHHFPQGKQEILLAVLVAGLEEITTQIEAIAVQALAPAEKFRAAVTMHILGVTENVAIGAAMVFEIRTLLDIPEVREAYIARRDAFERLFRQILQEGVAQGVFVINDIKLAVRMVLGAQNWVGVWYRAGGPLTGVEIAAQMAEWFLYAFQYPARMAPQAG
ncbi:MAG: TetR/AcrR family transcriptional regulator [Anaerolineae bacterium]|nr:TetR/AcrR family transcriptional regulator [Anaerolineae bacterium]